MMLEYVAFGIISTAIVGSAIGAVTSRNLVHSVLFLASTLLSTAVLYVHLESALIAGIQVILYTGGVITLMLFGILLTDDTHAVTRQNRSTGHLAGGIGALAMFGFIIASIHKSALPSLPQTFDINAKSIGFAFLTKHLLAFEALSLLLLAALVGAVVLARRSDP